MIKSEFIDKIYKWEKTEEEIAGLIDRFTRVGELILDPFGGSGVTAVCCMERRRKYIIIEKDADNIKIIKGRLMKLYKEMYEGEEMIRKNIKKKFIGKK